MSANYVAQTRQKLKEAYAAEFAATIERAEKQIILAKHGRRLLHLLDDTPVVPGDLRPSYAHGAQARQILNDAEDDLRDWRAVDDEEDDGRLDTGHQEQLMSGGLHSPVRSGGTDTAAVARGTGTGGTEGERYSGGGDGVETEATSQKSPRQHEALAATSPRSAVSTTTGPHSQQREVAQLPT